MENGITVKSAERVYQRVLAGENLDGIETSVEMRHLICEFMKLSLLSASQISQNSDIPIRIALALSGLNKQYKKRLTYSHTSGIIRSADIAFTVKRLLKGDSVCLIRSRGIGDETLGVAMECVTALQVGGGTLELYKLGVSHQDAVKIIKFIDRVK
ncbi:MAG TPA: hypothetical protein VGL27_17365 [Negativicutes bacterium]|jgi:hypothetical protein